jgi:hypothetical protein
LRFLLFFQHFFGENVCNFFLLEYFFILQKLKKYGRKVEKRQN